MTEIRQKPDESEEEFWARVDPYDDRLSRELPRWSCLVILAVLAGVVGAALWLLT